MKKIILLPLLAICYSTLTFANSWDPSLELAAKKQCDLFIKREIKDPLSEYQKSIHSQSIVNYDKLCECVVDEGVYRYSVKEYPSFWSVWKKHMRMSLNSVANYVPSKFLNKDPYKYNSRDKKIIESPIWKKRIFPKLEQCKNESITTDAEKLKLKRLRVERLRQKAKEVRLEELKIRNKDSFF